jgi:hypothetical protein
MSRQPNCTIAPSWTACYEPAMPSVTVTLQVRGGEPSHGLKRWSG